jgi:hypothetical protein
MPRILSFFFEKSWPYNLMTFEKILFNSFMKKLNQVAIESIRSET